MPSSRLPLRRFWLAAAGSVAVGGAAMAFCATGILPASGQSQGNAAAIAQAGTTIGVYSGRHYNTDKELYRQFTARTGIKVNLLEAKDDALLERLRSEGKNSPADVLVLVDAARLDAATDQGLFQPVRSAALQRDVPANLRDSQGRWYGLTRRVRAVVVNPKLVNPATIRTYADLAKPALKGKLCLRERKSPYNQSLVASRMILNGDAATRTWIRGMVANVSQPFFTSDTPLARAVARGECGVGVVNSYYIARMLSGEAGAQDKQLAQQLKVVYLNPSHVNITGAGVTRHARHPQAAIQLIEFLASPTGGRGYAEANNEYPLKGFGDNPILKRFGPFRADGVSVEQIGSKSRAATLMMESNGWK
ncbi:extracellular solute-binding protein [Cyanobium sp. Cruz CV13-4-11]|uniref:extracellular solute-binding protein n=1 Tax=unclassified Cyanobium TaxID=2627006 RepID=UPI0020CB908D|nr:MULTISPECIES: extracellular solute-binding protein [unclassified Cyanobium]MCP9900133.1 extracellular solute-binding protein [Cyanobium sp. Cruz CV11-17]MCP9919219.1 extracellular solute-binding protein [Cyanobium sp. Cruz CV13-4-11]